MEDSDTVGEGSWTLGEQRSIASKARDPFARLVLASALVTVGGAGAGFFAWAWWGIDPLEPFFTRNVLPSGGAARLGLSAGMFVVIFLAGWCLGSLYSARRGHRPLSGELVRLAPLSIIGCALYFLTFLIERGLEKYHPFVAMLAALGFSLTSLGFLLAVHPLRIKSATVRRWGPRAFLAVAVIGYGIYFSSLSIARHNSFNSRGCDLGTFDQVMWNSLRGRFRSTLMLPIMREYYILDHRESPLQHWRPNSPRTEGSRLAIHADFILVLLLPFYALWQDPRMLLIIQSVALASAALPLYLIARKKTQDEVFSSLLAAAYLLFPALHGVNMFDFHPLAMSLPLLLWALYFLEAERWIGFSVMLALSFLTGEQVPLTGIGIGAYILFGKRRWRTGVAVMFSSAVYYFVATSLVIRAAGGEAAYYQYSDMTSWAPGALGMLGTVLLNPFYALRYMFQLKKVLFLLHMLGPLFFLPLLSGWGLLVLAPSLALALLTWYGDQFDTRFHYTAVNIAAVFFLSACAAGVIRSRLQRVDSKRLIRAMAASSLIASLTLSCLFDEYGLMSKRSGHSWPGQSSRTEAAQRLIELIPSNAAVSAGSNMGAHLSHRRKIYHFPIINDAEYIIIDSSEKGWPLVHEQQEAIRLLVLESRDFGVMQYEEDIILARRGFGQQIDDMLLGSKFAAEK